MPPYTPFSLNGTTPKALSNALAMATCSTARRDLVDGFPWHPAPERHVGAGPGNFPGAGPLDEGWLAGRKGPPSVAVEMQAPKLKPFSVEAPVKRMFTASQLGPEWLHVRNFDPGYFSLSERKGYFRSGRSRTAWTPGFRKSPLSWDSGRARSAFRRGLPWNLRQPGRRGGGPLRKGQRL